MREARSFEYSQLFGRRERADDGQHRRVAVVRALSQLSAAHGDRIPLRVVVEDVVATDPLKQVAAAASPSQRGVAAAGPR
jgi:hypothetical protein